MVDIAMREASAILPARIPIDLERMRDLFREYAAGLGVDLGFQGFEQELAALPGKYAPPAGRVLLAWKNDQALGCVAMRALEGKNCEMKRLYVRAIARGEQLGRGLAEKMCEEAKAAGYSRIFLDTLAGMQSAQALYRSLGFREIAPYVFNPLPGTKYMARDL